MLKQISVTNIDLGELERTINQALAEVGADVHSRPHVEKARTVTVKISVIPEQHEVDGVFVNYPEIRYEVKIAKPSKAVTGMKGYVHIDQDTGEVELQVNGNMPESRDDPRQSDIFDLSERREKKQ